MTNRYLERALEKQSSASGLVLWHLGQNAATRKMLKSKAVGSRIANAFQQGMNGVHEGSLKRKATSFATSVVSPEIEALYRKSNQLGQSLGPEIKSLPRRAQVGLRQLSEGRFNDFHKLQGRMGLSDSHRQTFGKVLGAASPGVSEAIRSIQSSTPEVRTLAQKQWSSPEHPILSNILSSASRGKSTAVKPVQGAMRQSSPLLSQAATALVDAPGAAMNAVKASTLIDKVRGNKYLGKAIQKVEDHFTTHQARIGASNPGINKFKGGVKNLASEYIVNPVSHSIKNTSSTLARLSQMVKNPSDVAEAAAKPKGIVDKL